MALIVNLKRQLREAIDTIDDWCVKNEMALNKDKSYILFIPAKDKGGKERGKNVRGIRIVREAKYLGITIDDNLRFATQLNEWKKRLKSVESNSAFLKY